MSDEEEEELEMDIAICQVTSERMKHFENEAWSEYKRIAVDLRMELNRLSTDSKDK